MDENERIRRSALENEADLLLSGNTRLLRYPTHPAVQNYSTSSSSLSSANETDMSRIAKRRPKLLK